MQKQVNMAYPAISLLKSRRRFIRNISMAFSLFFIPIQACKRSVNLKRNSEFEVYVLNNSDRELLYSVMEHLFPNDNNGPGIEEIRAVHYFEKVINNKHLVVRDRRVLISGITWVKETSKRLFNADFVRLSTDRKEEVLRDIETHKKGKRWLQKVINYILEALLGSPEYGINKNGIGWEWLGHVSGTPQATSTYKYGTYGYGL